MEPRNERRRWPRSDSTLPEVGILFYHDDTSGIYTLERKTYDTLFIDLFNQTQGGARLRSSRNFEPDTIVHMQIYNRASKSWDFFPAMIKWENRSRDKYGNFLMGVEFLKHVQATKPSALPEYVPGKELSCAVGQHTAIDFGRTNFGKGADGYDSHDL